MPPQDESTDQVAVFAKLGIADSTLKGLSSEMIVALLVESGVSRLSAERVVAVREGEAEPGRARRHAHGHRMM